MPEAQPPPAPAVSEDDGRRPRRLARVAAVTAAVVLVVLAAGLAWVTAEGGRYVRLAPRVADAATQDAAARLAAMAPRGLHLRVDTFANRLWLFRGDEMLREAVCSTGSGVWLRDKVGGREWIFDTPLGERRVQRKVRDPVWSKPDWAFIEEGVEPPPPGDPARVDTISLGDYGIYLGNGYIIHGTLFQTLLGQSLTHGCIRLGDDDLKYVYQQLPVGAPVYLY